MEVYSFDENEAKALFAKIKEMIPDTKITIEDIKRKYVTYKAILEQDKIKWLKWQKNLPLDDFLEAVNIVSKDEINTIIKTVGASADVVIRGVASMGVGEYLKLKSEGNLRNLMHLEQHAEKLWNTMTEEELNLLLELNAYNRHNVGIYLFYSYYDFIKNSSDEEKEVLLQTAKDENEFNAKIRSSENSSYKYNRNIFSVPPGTLMVIIKNAKTEDIMKLRDKTGVPLNIIFAAMIDCDILLDDMLGKEQERLIMNFNKFRMNILDEYNREQMKELLLSIPEEASIEYEDLIKECVFGRLKDFDIKTFEQLQNYEEVCNQKIIEEFESNDDVEQIRDLILKAKIKDIDGFKRDIYYYKKYLGDYAEENDIYKLLKNLLDTTNKEELLRVYKSVSDMSGEFSLDSLFDKIRDELKNISKEDVANTMEDMLDELSNLETTNINGNDVINLTGTDFNLLVSVIASDGSPYFVDFYNKLGDWTFYNKDKMLSKDNIDKIVEIEYERRMKERYKKDPLKDKQRCVSSIDEDFLGHITSETNTEERKQKGKGLILAYFPTNKSEIFWMGNQDLMTRYDKPRTDESRMRMPHKDNLDGVCYLKLKDLNVSTIGDDNEIIVDSKPRAIVCFDEVSEISKETAQKFNMPILFIDSKEQFKIMKEKLDGYYDKIGKLLLTQAEIDENTFNMIFNEFEPNNNVIHRAFKIANSFCYLDEEDYPKDDVIQIFEKMKVIVRDAFDKCSSSQKQIIKNLMLKEADYRILRYGKYYEFIDFQELEGLVMEDEEEAMKDIKGDER